MLSPETDAETRVVGTPARPGGIVGDGAEIGVLVILGKQGSREAARADEQ
jgi:hypothetical protein